MAKAPLNIRSLARAHTNTALKVLASIMNDKEGPPAPRVQAATALLDRGWGKPTQPIDQTINDERPIADLTTAELAERASDALRRIDELTAGTNGAGTRQNGPANLHKLN